MHRLSIRAFGKMDAQQKLGEGDMNENPTKKQRPFREFVTILMNNSAIGKSVSKPVLP